MVHLATPGTAHAEESGGMESPGLFALGFIFSGIGATGLGVGGYFFNEGSGACDGISRSSVPSTAQVEQCRTGVIQQVGGGVGMATGGIFLLAGIPLMIVGALPEDDAPPAPRYGFRVEPTGAQFEMTF